MMNDKLKMNLIAAGASFAIIGSIVIGGFYYMTTARAEKAPQVSEAVVIAAEKAPTYAKDSPEGRAIEAVAQLHESFNKAVGWDNDVKFNAKDSESWDALLKLPEMKSETYRNLAKDLANIQGAEIDLNRVADLATIAAEKRDVKTLIYMHRILHDLDRHYFNHDQNTDFWGVTETIRRLTDAEEVVPDTRAEVAKHIDKNVK